MSKPKKNKKQQQKKKPNIMEKFDIMIKKNRRKPAKSKAVAGSRG